MLFRCSPPVTRPSWSPFCVCGLKVLLLNIVRHGPGSAGYKTACEDGSDDPRGSACGRAPASCRTPCCDEHLLVPLRAFGGARTICFSLLRGTLYFSISHLPCSHHTDVFYGPDGGRASKSVTVRECSDLWTMCRAPCQREHLPVRRDDELCALPSLFHKHTAAS